MSLVLAEAHGPIFRLALNRPEKKNALTLPMYGALTEGLRAAHEDPKARVIFLEGTPDCFTAGNDLADFAAAAGGVADLGAVFTFLHALVSAEKPIVASVRGVAVGIGTTALLHCDLVYAGTDARFQLPFVSLGLVPEAASSLLLPRLAGPARAAELLLLGEPFDAARAVELGIVTRALPPEESRAAAWAAAEKLATQPAGAVRAARSLLRGRDRAAVLAAMEEEAKEFLGRLNTPEFAEALAAFRERRNPDFSRFS